MSAERSAGTGGLVTSIARLEDDANGPALAQVLDLETILRNMNPTDRPDVNANTIGAPIRIKPGTVILAADDSVVARALIEQGLDAMGLPFIMTKTGKEAWDQLNVIASQAEADGRSVYDRVAMVLTDLEMPGNGRFYLDTLYQEKQPFQGLAGAYPLFAVGHHQRGTREIGGRGCVCGGNSMPMNWQQPCARC